MNYAAAQDKGCFGVYTGSGASHSWTWYADLFEREHITSVTFLDEHDIHRGALSSCRALFISGGDTFAVAEALGRTGAAKIEAFVSEGGTYIGSCAGAYLVLHSSLAPLNHFNFVKARIVNLTKDLPAPKQRSDKFCTQYGCRYVYHPVREAVMVSIDMPGHDLPDPVFAPLYGGPSLTASEDIEVIARYTGFCTETEYLIDEETAGATLIGNVAGAVKKKGKGFLYLFGPHFEHPEYPDANSVIMGIVRSLDSKEGADAVARKQTERPASEKAFRRFLSSLSNARIVGLALERSTYSWIIGRKVYEPEKIRVFLEALWQRANSLYASGLYRHAGEDEIVHFGETCSSVVQTLRRLRSEDAGMPLQHSAEAEQMFSDLRNLSARFLACYFRLLRNGCVDSERRFSCTCISRQRQHCTVCQS